MKGKLTGDTAPLVPSLGVASSSDPLLVDVDRVVIASVGLETGRSERTRVAIC